MGPVAKVYSAPFGQVVLLLLTEIAPKSIAVHNATEVARVVVRCLR